MMSMTEITIWPWDKLHSHWCLTFCQSIFIILSPAEGQDNYFHYVSCGENMCHHFICIGITGIKTCEDTVLRQLMHWRQRFYKMMVNVRLLAFWREMQTPTNVMIQIRFLKGTWSINISPPLHISVSTSNHIYRKTQAKWHFSVL